MTALQYTYATLAAAMQNWPEDDDTDYVAAIPELIQHGELGLTKDLDLEVFEQDLTANINTGVATITKPATMIAPRSLRYTNVEYVELENRSVDYVRQHGAVAASGNPRFYAELNETTWVISPTPNFTGTLNVRAIQRVAGLDNAVGGSTSFLSTRFPDLLLKRCLIAAQNYLKGDEKWKQLLSDYAIEVTRGISEVAVLRKTNSRAEETLAQFRPAPAQE